MRIKKKTQKYPENTSEIIKSVLKKYGFEVVEDLLENENLELLRTSEGEKEFIKRWNNLPDSHVAEVLSEFNQDKLKDTKELARALQERLNTSGEISRKMARELEEKIFNAPEERPFSEKDFYREPIE